MGIPEHEEPEPSAVTDVGCSETDCEVELRCEGTDDIGSVVPPFVVWYKKLRLGFGEYVVPVRDQPIAERQSASNFQSCISVTWNGEAHLDWDQPLTMSNSSVVPHQ